MMWKGEIKKGIERGRAVALRAKPRRGTACRHWRMEKHNQKKPANFSGYFHDLAYYLAYYLELSGVVIVQHGYRTPPVQIAWGRNTIILFLLSFHFLFNREVAQAMCLLQKFLCKWKKATEKRESPTHTQSLLPSCMTGSIAQRYAVLAAGGV